MKFILGTKKEMSQLFADDGKVTPVTIIKAGPCQVTQVKNKEKDHYQAVQIGFGEKKKLTKALLGHLKNLPKFRYLKEFKFDEGQELTKGQEIKVNVFQVGDIVKITGVSKGKGFQGVVKRHGFHGSPASHGHKDQLRMPGSIGATAPAHVFKGTRMAGRMGGDQVSVTNLEIVKVDLENNLLYIKGAIPGARNGLILVQGPGELKVIEEPSTSTDATADKKEETSQEEKPTESKEEVSPSTSKEVPEDKKEEKIEEPVETSEKKDEKKEEAKSINKEEIKKD